MEFEGPTWFRDFIRLYGCMRGMTSSSQRMTVIKTICVCKVDGCLFRSNASFSQDKTRYILKTFRPNHNCGRAANNK